VRLDGRAVNAKWTVGEFVNQVTVRTPGSNLIVKVDGFPFQTSQNGILTASVPGGAVTIEVPSNITGPGNSKMFFSNWNRFGKSNPLRVVMNSTLDITAKYTPEYSVAVYSPYGAPQGSGWYLEGTNATFAVNSPVDLGNGTRRVFTRWAGDSNSTVPQAWLIVNSGKALTAEWKTQYALTISAPGLPANASVSVLLGNQRITLNGPKPVTEWVDANQQLSITVQNQHVQVPAGNYSFSELRADNQTFAGLIIVTQPITISLIYSQSPNPSPRFGLEGSQTNAAAPPVTLSPGSIAILLRNSLMVGRNIPVISPMISFATSLANIGYLLAAFIVPGGPPITGYLLGSLFIGLIYVFPVSALLVLYRSSRTKRQPNLRTLTPLAIVWAASTALVLLSPDLGGIQSFLAVLQVLLMLTTMLLFPLLIAFRVARLVT
jgi:hypothetical protein